MRKRIRNKEFFKSRFIKIHRATSQKLVFSGLSKSQPNALYQKKLPNKLFAWGVIVSLTGNSQEDLKDQEASNLGSHFGHMSTAKEDKMVSLESKKIESFLRNCIEISNLWFLNIASMLSINDLANCESNDNDFDKTSNLPLPTGLEGQMSHFFGGLGDTQCQDDIFTFFKGFPFN